LINKILERLYTTSGPFLSYFLLLLLCWVFLCAWISPSNSQAQTLAYSQGIAFEPRPDERFLSAFSGTPGELVILSVQADTRRKLRVLRAYGFQTQNGQLRWKQTLDSAQVGAWQHSPGKGGVVQSFENALASGLRGDRVIPLAYQYQVSLSPDGSRILAYAYDYSQKNLLARLAVFDTRGRLLQKEDVPVDNGALNYGFYVHNGGEIYVLNGNAAGDIQLIEYASRGQRYLMEVPGESGNRQQFRLQLTPTDAWVVNTVGRAGGITGTMISRFDLKNRSTSQVQYLPLPESVRALRPNLLAGCRVSNRNEVSIVLEQKNILGTGYQFRPDAVNDAAAWQSRKTMVQLGNQVMLTYDTLGVSLDEKRIRLDEKMADEKFYERVSFVVSPVPGLPTLLITEKQLIRLEKKGAAHQLNTYIFD
jgi:hypothetical protein